MFCWPVSTVAVARVYALVFPNTFHAFIQVGSDDYEIRVFKNEEVCTFFCLEDAAQYF